MKKLKRAQDAMFGGALALQSTRVLDDRSMDSLVGTAQGFVGIGITGALANQAFDMASGNYKTKKRRKK